MTHQHRIASGFICVLALWVCWVSFTQKPSEAYLFPRLISVIMVGLAVWTFVKALLGRSANGTGIDKVSVGRFLPGLIITIVYLFWAAKALGFYTSSTIAFITLLSLYDGEDHTNSRAWIKRVVITVGYIAVMYFLFSYILNVYTPRGVFM